MPSGPTLEAVAKVTELTLSSPDGVPPCHPSATASGEGWQSKREATARANRDQTMSSFEMCQPIFLVLVEDVTSAS